MDLVTAWTTVRMGYVGIFGMAHPSGNSYEPYSTSEHWKMIIILAKTTISNDTYPWLIVCGKRDRNN